MTESIAQLDKIMDNGQKSKYEKNIFLQPELIRDILEAPLPGWMKKRPVRVFFIGVGTNFHAAQIAQWLWRKHVSPEAWAVHSFDFVRTPQPIGPKDVAVLLSHRGTKSFTVEAARIVRRKRAVAVAITGQGSPWAVPLAHRLDTCEQEDTGAFTKSLSTTLAWIARWIGHRPILAEMRRACERIEAGPAFSEVGEQTDLVLLGDGPREWIARETSLKIQEAAYRPVRAFGLEEFLHGPRISVGKDSVVVAFSSPGEDRWEAVRSYLRTIKVPLIEVQGESIGLSEKAGWLWQLFWGQRLTLDICRRFDIDPDSLRTTDSRYKQAREALKL